jgi:molecular chaperone DnaK (HSP70)
MTIIGIDLGTSSSAAAVPRGGRPVMIPRAEGITLGGNTSFLGESNLDGPVPTPHGVPKIEVAFDIDASGIYAAATPATPPRRAPSPAAEQAPGARGRAFDAQHTEAKHG